MSAHGDMSSPSLLRTLGLFDCTSLVVGIVIGSGIFLTTGIMATSLPSVPLLLAVWTVGGLLTIAGALTFAELAAAMPEAGGQYVYLRRAYGPLPAFLFGWLTFVVYQTGAIAGTAVGFAEYLGYFVPQLGTARTVLAFSAGSTAFRVSAGQLAACAGIVGLTIVNVRGLYIGSLVQNVLTLVKIAAISAFVIFGFVLGFGAQTSTQPPPPPGSFSVVHGFGVALIAVLWTYDGWNNLTFSASEVRKPERTLPLALIFGTLIVTLLYVMTNAAYLYALPIEEVRGETRIAEKAASALFGAKGAALIAAAVLVCTLGATNGVILTTARVFFAMARDGLFFKSVGRVHPRFHTPHVSLWLQCAWSCALALSGSYDQLITSSIFAGLLTYLAATGAVFQLRRREPDMPRPYRTWGYPIAPALFMLAIAAIIVNTLIQRPVESLSGLGLLFLGLPVYFFWSRRRRASVDLFNNPTYPTGH